MPEVAMVDASVLFASINRRDLNHLAAASLLRRRDLLLVIPALVIAETAYLVDREFGAAAEAAFIRGLADQAVDTPTAEEWIRVAELMSQYVDFPLGAADASLMELAERLKTDLILTLDRRHFAAVRPKHVNAFRILPE
jgi:uncharacterized protein